MVINGEGEKVWQISNNIMVALAAFVMFLLGVGVYEMQRQISIVEMHAKERMLEIINQQNETRNLIVELLKVTNRIDSEVQVTKHDQEESKKRENQLDEYLKHHSHIDNK